MSTNNPDIQVPNWGTMTYTTLTTMAEKKAHYEAEKAVIQAVLASGMLAKGHDTALLDRGLVVDTLIALNTET